MRKVATDVDIVTIIVALIFIFIESAIVDIVIFVEYIVAVGVLVIRI